jgi:hypothetical protein
MKTKKIKRILCLIYGYFTACITSGLITLALFSLVQHIIPINNTPVGFLLTFIAAGIIGFEIGLMYLLYLGNLEIRMKECDG